jgi:DNA invertase Pin-like site-specific DNA recombinase
MKIGYTRASTEDQNPDLLLTVLNAVRCDRIFTINATSTNVKRPEMIKYLKALNNGDTLVFWKLDWLGRSLYYLLNLIAELNQMGGGLPLCNGSHRHHKPNRSRVMWQMVDKHAELKPPLIQEWTKAGRTAANPWSEDGAKIKVKSTTSLPR